MNEEFRNEFVKILETSNDIVEADRRAYNFLKNKGVDLKDNIFQKEYFDFYDFMVDAEITFRKEHYTHKISTGFLYLGGKQPVYNVISAVKTEKEAYSLLNNKTTIEILSELLEDIQTSAYTEDKWLISVIMNKIRELEEGVKII